MKKATILFSVLFFAVLFSIPAGAVQTGSAVNRFIFDSSVLSDEDSSGDLVAFGNMVSVSGAVSGDIVTAGNTVTVTSASVGNNVFAAGNNVTIGIKSAKNIYAAGAMINVGKDASVGGAYLAGANVNFEGSAKELYASGETVTINGTVDGTATISADTITFGDGAKINGNLVIRSALQPVLPDSIDSSKVEFIKTENNRRTGMRGRMGAFPVISALLCILTAVILSLIFTLLGGGYFKRRALEFKKTGGRTVLFGLIALIVIPVACVLAMFTVIAIPVSIIVLIIYGITLYLATAYTGTVLGHLVFQRSNRYLAAMAGAAALRALTMIPYVGMLFYFACALYTLGSLVTGMRPVKKTVQVPEAL